MKIYVVGTGPGEVSQITPKALEAIKASNVIAGYGVYIDLIDELIEGKEIIQTPMKQEVKRCQMAIDSALEGNTVAMISSGDAGVYGMAGLIYELAEPHPNLEIEVIPGVTAASSAASVLGAPLIHDFAVISLNDLLTPWEKIEKRGSPLSSLGAVATTTGSPLAVRAAIPTTPRACLPRYSLTLAMSVSVGGS